MNGEHRRIDEESIPFRKVNQSVLMASSVRRISGIVLSSIEFAAANSWNRLSKHRRLGYNRRLSGIVPETLTGGK